MALFASILILFAGVISPLCIGAISSHPITITTWNLNWLYDEGRQGKGHSVIPPRTARDYQAIANIITEISPDVFAFQEVADNQSIEKVISLKDYHVEFSSRKDNDDVWPQFVGFAIRKGISYQRHPDLHQLDVWGNQYLRYGVDISLYQEGKPALRLLAVHLKSGCFSNRHRNKNCTVLKEQFEVIENWISKRQKHKQPFIILGDFNRRLANKGDKFWQKLTSGLTSVPTLVTKNRESQCRSQAYSKRKKQWEVRQYPGFIDHLIVDSQIQEKDNKVSFSEYLYRQSPVKTIYAQ